TWGRVFRRGFVEGITMAGQGFVTYAGYLFSWAPLKEVRLLWFPAEALASLPLLARLTRIALPDTSISDYSAKVLVASPHLSEGVWIDLRESKTDHLSEAGRRLLVSRFGNRVHF